MSARVRTRVESINRCMYICVSPRQQGPWIHQWMAQVRREDPISSSVPQRTRAVTLQALDFDLTVAMT